MRKPPLIYIFPFLFFILTCNLQPPKEVEIIIQSPRMRFITNENDFKMSDLFGDLEFKFIDDDNTDVNVIDCGNMRILTKVVYIELYRGDVSKDIEDKLIYDSEYYPTGDGLELLRSKEPYIKIENPDFSDTHLKGFEFKPLMAKLYLSGSNDEFLDMTIVNIFKDNDKLNDEPFGKSDSSGILKTDTEYYGTELPFSENEFVLDLNEEFFIKFSVLLKPNQSIPKTWVDEGLDILVEIAVWVPFDLIAVEPDGVMMELPFNSMFGDNADIFGRENYEDESIADNIEYINLEIRLSENPFPGSKLIVNKDSPNGHIESFITNRIYAIKIEKDKLIFPFKPDFNVFVEHGRNIIIPKLLLVEDISLTAKLSYLFELKEDEMTEEGWEF